jgi:chromosome segregation ATPase
MPLAGGSQGVLGADALLFCLQFHARNSQRREAALRFTTFRSGRFRQTGWMKLGIRLITPMVLVSLSCIPGCDRDPDAKTLDAANAKIEGLQAEIQAKNLANQNMQTEVTRLQQELEALRQKSSTETQKQIDAIQKADNDNLLNVKENFRQKLANLQQSLADTQIQLSLSEKDRLSLKGLVDQPARLASIATTNSSIERVVWISVVFASLALSGCFAVGYFNMRGQRRQAIVAFIGRHS